jgi:hypothetical protein
VNCETAKDLLLLADCGELSFEQEEQLEQHVGQCHACAAERQRLLRLGALLESQRMEMSPALLARCRRDFSARWRAETMPAGWTRFSAWWRRPALLAWMRPAAALGLVALGFFGGRTLMPTREPAIVEKDPASTGRPALAQVPLSTGTPAVAAAESHDDARSKAYAIDSGDARLRSLLLAAVKAEDPALRIDSIDVLRRHCDDENVRRALLEALQNDKSSGVRLRALEAPQKPRDRNAE